MASYFLIDWSSELWRGWEKVPTTERHGMNNELFHVRVSASRRVVLPAEACKRRGINLGDTAIVDVSEGKVHLHSFATMLAEFRSLLAGKISPNVNVVDELLAERRAEGRRSEGHSSSFQIVMDSALMIFSRLMSSRVAFISTACRVPLYCAIMPLS